MSGVLLGLAKPRLLDTLVLRSDVPLHLREIARRSGVALGQVQRELAALVDAGLLRRTRSGGRVLYGPRRDHPSFPSVRSLLVAEAGGLGALVREALEDLAASGEPGPPSAPSPAALWLNAGEAAEVVTIGLAAYDVLTAIGPLEERLGVVLHVTSLERLPRRSEDAARRWWERRAASGTWLLGGPGVEGERGA